MNSKGVVLNQADFILTLLSVFGEDIRKRLEDFSIASRQPSSPGQPSPFNRFIEPGPDQLLKVAVALAFYRGRLKSVYQVLRGKDPESDTISAELRDEQFERLRVATDQALDLTHWHGFLNAIAGAGFRSGDLISSENSLIFTYVHYLAGKIRFGLPEHQLDRLIGKWFYANTLTRRYTYAPETSLESDLNVLKGIPDGSAFAATLNRFMDDSLTNDFWEITLPNDLETSAGRSPGLFAYYAAQNALHAPVLFSSKKMPELFDPVLQSTRKPLERHHLFPRAWLAGLGVEDKKQYNQVANFAHVEWPDNMDISDSAPFVYVKEMRSRFDEATWRHMHQMHALPDGWWDMEYEDFLDERRKLMAVIIRRGYESF